MVSLIVKLYALNSELQGKQEIETAYNETLTLMNRPLEALVDFGDAVLHKLNELKLADAGVMFFIEDGAPRALSCMNIAPPDKMSEAGDECLRRKTPLRFTGIEADQFRPVATSLGAVSPREIALFPLAHKDKTLGVLELGRIEEYSAGQIALLQRIADQTAGAMNSMLAFEGLRKMSEQMAGANRELKQFNLELQSMNAELKMQQDEINQTNEKLKEASGPSPTFWPTCPTNSAPR